MESGWARQPSSPRGTVCICGQVRLSCWDGRVLRACWGGGLSVSTALMRGVRRCPHLRPRPRPLTITWEPPAPALHTLSARCAWPPAALQDPCPQATSRPTLPPGTTSSVHWAGGQPPAALSTDEGDVSALTLTEEVHPLALSVTNYLM